MITIEEKLNFVRHNVDTESHICINKNICKECEHRVCTRACPAECFKYDGDEIEFSYEGCLECGTCRIACDMRAIDWNYPKGGFGVCFRFG